MVKKELANLELTRTSRYKWLVPLQDRALCVSIVCQHYQDHPAPSPTQQSLTLFSAFSSQERTELPLRFYEGQQVWDGKATLGHRQTQAEIYTNQLGDLGPVPPDFSSWVPLTLTTWTWNEPSLWPL